MRFATRLRITVITAALVLVAASCGASVPESTIDSLKSTTTAAATTTPDDGAAPETTASDTTAPDTTTPDKQEKASGGDFCEEIEKFIALDDTAIDSGLDMDDDDFDKAQLSEMKKSMAEVDETFARAAAAAPAEIADDMELLASVFSSLSEAVSKAETPDELFAAFFSMTIGNVDEEDLDRASDRIEKFTADECGLDMSDLD